MPNRGAAALAFFLAAGACREAPEAPDPAIAQGRLVRRKAGPGRAISAIVPAQARAGEVFQRQPNGRAALAVLGSGFAQGDEIFWAGHHLPTTLGNSRLLTATIPAELLAEPGEVAITIQNGADPSKTTLRASFRLLPPAPVPPP